MCYNWKKKLKAYVNISMLLNFLWSSYVMHRNFNTILCNFLHPHVVYALPLIDVWEGKKMRFTWIHVLYTYTSTPLMCGCVEGVRQDVADWKSELGICRGIFENNFRFCRLDTIFADWITSQGVSPLPSPNHFMPLAPCLVKRGNGGTERYAF